MTIMTDLPGTLLTEGLKVGKRKVALILGYKGTQYAGMQINPNVQTIEEILFKSLTTLGYISEENGRHPSKVSRGVAWANGSWTRISYLGGPRCR